MQTVESVAEQAMEVAHMVGTERLMAEPDSSEEAGRLKGARDCQMPAVARSMPSDSGLRQVLPCPHLGYLEMAVDTGTCFEDS